MLLLAAIPMIMMFNKKIIIFSMPVSKTMRKKKLTMVMTNILYNFIHLRLRFVYTITEQEVIALLYANFTDFYLSLFISCNCIYSYLMNAFIR